MKYKFIHNVFHTLQIPATKRFTNPSFLPCCSGISNVALSSLIYQDFCPFYTNQYLPKGFDWHRLITQWLSQVHSILTILFSQLWLDKLSDTAPNRHIGGGTMESVYWSHKGRKKFIHERKTNYKDKISLQNDTKCIIYTPHMAHRATWSMKILCKQIIR